VRVSTTLVCGVGFVVWANVGVVIGSRNRLDASRPIPTTVENRVFVIALSFCESRDSP
jgi:hypothetical protein